MVLSTNRNDVIELVLGSRVNYMLLVRLETRRGPRSLWHLCAGVCVNLSDWCGPAHLRLRRHLASADGRKYVLFRACSTEPFLVAARLWTFYHRSRDIVPVLIPGSL